VNTFGEEENEVRAFKAGAKGGKSHRSSGHCPTPQMGGGKGKKERGKLGAKEENTKKEKGKVHAKGCSVN